jgi:hypothetical protein
MDALLASFKHAYENQDGYTLAAILDPEAYADSGQRYAFYRSSNAMAIQNDLRSALIYHSDVRLTKEEANAWIEIFAALWSAMGELLLAEQHIEKQRSSAPNWTNTYKAWRALTTTLQKNFQRSILPYWAVPAMYAASAYLRVFAMKADKDASEQSGDISFSTGLQDDVVSDVGKHENLQDAARIMNMVFAAFASDRSVVQNEPTRAFADIVTEQHLKSRGNGVCMPS